MSEPASLTILTCAKRPGISAGKVFRTVDGTVSSTDYNCGIIFSHREVIVSDFEDLCGQLNLMASGPVGECFAVRGAVKPEHREKHRIFRRYTHPDPTTNHLADVPQSWAALDLDGWPLPEGLDVVQENNRAFLWARQVLAGCSSGLASQIGETGFVWQASNSCGIKPGLRGKIWLLLTTPLTCEELRRWCKSANSALKLSGQPPSVRLDEMQCAPTQPIYIRNPKFDLPLVDPMQHRWGLVPGPRAHLVPPPVPLAPRRLLADSRRRARARFSNWASVLNHLGPAGWRSVISRAVHRAVADGIAPQEIKKTIWAAAEGRNSQHGDAYDERILAEHHLDELIAHAQSRELAAEAAEFELLKMLNAKAEK